MRKVKDYLDKHFFPSQEITTNEKDNGQLGVFGDYHYPEKIEKYLFHNQETPNNCILISLNNETLIIRAIHKKKHINKYHYLQTYLHLPYRWSDEQVIEHIQEYKDILDKHKNRKKRIKKLLS